MISYSDILLSVLKFITLDGRPFSIVDDNGFSIIQQIVKQINSNSNKPLINVKNAKKLLTNAATSIREKMKEVFRNNFLSIKMDGAWYFNRKFVGIMSQTRNLQNLNEFHSYTLGCIEVFESQTTDNITKTLLKVLSKFEVNENQIFSITTDNAANILNVAPSMNADRVDKSKKKAEEREKDLENENDDLQGDYQIEEFIINNDEEEAEIEFGIQLSEFKRLAFEHPSIEIIGKLKKNIHNK